jgi:hypothetical protein
MFILTRQDVEITSISHPSNQDQKIPILLYRDQTFRLLRAFGNDRETAAVFWRDLVDNKGKNCILLEEPESGRFSVWGKFVFDKNLVKPTANQNPENTAVIPPVQKSSAQPNAPQLASEQTYSKYIDISLVKACLLILQTIYLEIEDLFGARQASLFKEDVLQIFLKEKFPKVDSMEKLERLLLTKDLANISLPTWNDRQLQILLKELYKISKSHFGNTVFLDAARDAIEELPPVELTKFQTWLSKIANGHLWQ